MKEIEAKTENRYEYRKPQEKRKHMIAPDLFEFAYVPDWYGQLEELERLALPESWKFRKPSRETKNTVTPILERYIHTIFRKQVIDFNSESDTRKADGIFHLENECACFHTGLYTRQYKGIYLSVLTGWEHESFGIGDVVTVDDKDLGIRISTRIIRMDYNVQEPWKTVIELSTKLKELGDSSASGEKAADTLSSSDLLDRQEMKDLVVNNHLLNSRADDGFSYWQNSGFEVDGENGASGNASFKCVGALNTTKTLSQEVYPATRSSYTVSASIATENLKKGTNGRVGIELIIEYEDGSEETRFVELFWLT